MLKKKSLLQKVISLNLLILSVFLFQTCSKDDTVTEPETKPSLATATIGIDGGSLKTEDFELSIPVGAFPSASNLILKLVENEDFGSDNIVSREFEIEGLPQSFSQPLTIKIKYSDELTDSSYIAIGENGWVSSLNQVITSYHYLSAIDSLGYLTAKIAPIENNNSALGKSNSTQTESNKKYFHIRSANKTILTREKHFIIYAKSYFNETDVHNIGAYLETAYTKYEDLGFQYNRRTVWPIEVYIEEGLKSADGGSVDGYSANTLWSGYNLFNSYNAGYLRFNADLIADAGIMKAIIGHEFFHLVQGLYDTRNIWDKISGPASNYWIYEASSTWAEGLFSNDSNYVSSVFSENSSMVLYGANNGNIENVQDGDYSPIESYGYAMAVFFKYITNKYNNEIVVKIYDEIYKGNTSFVAIEKVIPTPVVDIWNDFLEQFLRYNIYKADENYKPGWLSSEATSAAQYFQIKDDTDTLKVYSKNYWDLSARIFSVRTSATTLSEIDENSKLIIETEGNIDGNIFLFKENKNENRSVFLQRGQNSVTLDNFKKITDSSYAIIAVVSNSNLVAPYSGRTAGKVTIKVINMDQSNPKPVITEIFDANTDYYFSEKRNFTAPGGEYIKIKGSNFKDLQKIVANGVEFEKEYFGQNGDTLCFIRLPYFSELRNEHTGHVNIKVATATGESNELSYIIGQPIDYISSSDSLRLEIDFSVMYYTSEGVLKTKRLNLEHGFIKNELNWSENIVTIDLSTISDITGSVQCTFSNLENCEIDNVVLDYSKNEGDGGYNIHYEENNLNIGPEGMYRTVDNPQLTHTLVFNKIEKRYTEQPSLSGVISYYDSALGEYRDTGITELDLTADSYNRRFEISLIHFR